MGRELLPGCRPSAASRGHGHRGLLHSFRSSRWFRALLYFVLLASLRLSFFPIDLPASASLHLLLSRGRASVMVTQGVEGMSSTLVGKSRYKN